jgi:hypothetical protein
MDERRMIETLEYLEKAIAEKGHDTASIRRFLDVGEWLIAFEGIENFKRFDVFIKSDVAMIDSLRDYFRA